MKEKVIKRLVKKYNTTIEQATEMVKNGDWAFRRYTDATPAFIAEALIRTDKNNAGWTYRQIIFNKNLDIINRYCYIYIT